MQGIPFIQEFGSSVSWRGNIRFGPAKNLEPWQSFDKHPKMKILPKKKRIWRLLMYEISLGFTKQGVQVVQALFYFL